MNSVLSLSLRFILVFLTISAVRLQSTTSMAKKDCYLPDSCKWLDYHSKSKAFFERILQCSDLNADFDESKFHTSYEYCAVRDQYYYLYKLDLVFKHYNSKFILDNSFKLVNILFYLDALYYVSITFVGLKGLNVDLAICMDYFVYFNVYDSKFDFYDQNGKVIRTCQEYTSAVKVKKSFIFKYIEKSYWYTNFVNAKFTRPICPEVFQNVRLDLLSFGDLVKSYYKTNTLQFLRRQNQSNSLNTKIKEIHLNNFYGLDLDLDLIDAEIFKETEIFSFYGIINTIQEDLFKNFKNFKSVWFNPVYRVSQK